MSQKSKLLSAIALLVIALGVVVYLIFRGPGPDDTTLTAEQLSRYEEGTFYRTTVTSTVQGKTAGKDWGIETAVHLVHQGESDFIRHIKSVNEDHTEVVVGLEILSARDLEVRLALDDLTLDLPPAVGLLGKGAQFMLLPGGAVEATDRVADWLKSEPNRQRVLSWIEGPLQSLTGKGIADYLLEAKLQPFEAYEGITAEYTYEAGQGLVDFQSDGSLSEEQEARVRNFSVYSEAYLLPDPDPEGPDEWEVDVKNIAHLLAPGSELEVGGTLTLKRDSTSGDETRLTIVKGKVVFSGASDTDQVLGTWAARGSFYYNLKTHSIIEGDLSGSLSLERKSTDHILFEESFTSEPTYRIRIKGYATRDSEVARREVNQATMTR